MLLALALSLAEVIGARHLVIGANALDYSGYPDCRPAFLEAFEDLLRLYPTSEYAAEARDQARLVRDNLADHEYIVADFYLRYGIPQASVTRLEYLLESYPDYSAKDKVYYFLGQAYTKTRRIEDAAGAR